jgi:hypothetical protein
MLPALDGTGETEWFADYAQWESAQERKTEEQNRASTSRPSKTSRAESESTPKAKRSGLSYREQKEWAKMEQRILQAEETIATCQAAVEDPAIASNAAALQERSAALDQPGQPPSIQPLDRTSRKQTSQLASDTTSGRFVLRTAERDVYLSTVQTPT